MPKKQIYVQTIEILYLSICILTYLKKYSSNFTSQLRIYLEIIGYKYEKELENCLNL